MKRILLLADDSLITNFYREKFQAAGVAIETARNREAALKIIEEKSPELLLTDLIIPSASALETVKVLRAALGAKPLFVFSKLPADIVAAAEKSGATKVLGDMTPDAIVREVQSALGLPAAGSTAAASDDKTEFWLSAVVEAAPEAINSIRTAMHVFIRDTRDSDALYALFRELHILSSRATLAGLVAVGKMTGAVETLVYDLYTMPEQVNPSVLRTVSQSIDFLTSLFEEKNVRRAQDPSSSDVFVVDDEASARQLISAAMKMVDLKITCAADPEMALCVLEDNNFNLIFLDINLPERSGFDLCTKVRQLEDHRKTPVVFLTGMATFQNRAQSSLSGGNDFIGKPFNLHELGVKALTWIFKDQLAMV